jgi:alkylated DNA repair dioxygenase AlkB
MGMHADDEAELGPEPVIASLSLGETRTLVFKHKQDKSLKPVKIPLASGSLLLMRGRTQARWKHGINRQSKPCGPRVNLTFRSILPAEK